MKLSLRKDEVKAFTDQERLFCHANRMEDGHVVVPRVMGWQKREKQKSGICSQAAFEGSQNLETVIGMEICVELKTLSKMFVFVPLNWCTPLMKIPVQSALGCWTGLRKSRGCLASLRPAGH